MDPRSLVESFLEESGLVRRGRVDRRQVRLMVEAFLDEYAARCRECIDDALADPLSVVAVAAWAYGLRRGAALEVSDVARELRRLAPPELAAAVREELASALAERQHRSPG